MYRIWKPLFSLSYLIVIWLTWRWFHDGLDMTFHVGCLVLSGLWLALTRVRLNHLLRTYFDLFSRLQMTLPMIFGSLLCTLVLVTHGSLEVSLVSGAQLAMWLAIFIRFRANLKHYKTVGHGPMPIKAWLNPPADAFEAGDVMLTGGNTADSLHEPVGHGEIAVPDGDKMMSFSAYMDQGTVFNPLEQVATGDARDGYYIVMRQVVPWTEEEKVLAPLICKAMLRQNRAWVLKMRALRDAILDWLHAPAWLRARVLKKFPISGYAWLGLVNGGRACDHWTCIAAVMELIWRMGRVMRWLGFGLFNFGTGLFDPISPDQFLIEPTLRLLTLDDKRAYEIRKGIRAE